VPTAFVLYLLAIFRLVSILLPDGPLHQITLCMPSLFCVLDSSIRVSSLRKSEFLVKCGSIHSPVVAKTQVELFRTFVSPTLRASELIDVRQILTPGAVHIETDRPDAHALQEWVLIKVAYVHHEARG